jgi:ribosome-binding protein aMBF1 (putative translation factor)
VTKQEYQALCAEWRSKPTKELFGRIVAGAAEVIPMSKTQLAVHFEVSESIIDTWASGRADPIEYRKNHIVSELTKLAA